MSSNDLKSNKLWVFGYGSLCWHPGFEYTNTQLGFIRGYSRKFWQGNTVHRGTEEKPGRVATLIEENETITWGISFELVGEAALKYLETRECKLGGYQTLITTFYPRNVITPFPVILYIATTDNSQYLGPAPMHEIASQISESQGASGHNVEYVIRLAEFFRNNLPEVQDDHLFTLESLIRQKIQEKQININQLMGNKELSTTLPTSSNAAVGAGAAPQENPEIRRDSFQYQSRVAPKKLLCLNV